MKLCLTGAIAALVLLSGPALAAGNDACYTTYYQAKTPACLDTLAAMVHGYQANAADPANHSNLEAMAGFLAVIFSTSPEEKERLLAQETSAGAKGLYVEALYRAGLPDQAKAYADANNLTDIYRRYQNANLATLETVKPDIVAADNDLLIGAYMASGDAGYLKRLLANFAAADDSGASNALRMGLVQSKFGATLAPPGRGNDLVSAICLKYECKLNPKPFIHEAVMASAFWALQSLARQDAGVKKTLGEFFDGDPRLKKLLAAEANAFANYVTLVAAYAAIKDNPDLNAALLAYENLGSAQDSIDAMHLKK